LIIDVAEAVRTALAAGAFSQTFTPVRLWYVNWPLQDLSTLRVCVVPAAIELQGLARSKTGRKALVDISVHKKPLSLAPADVDPLVILTEEILDFFVPKEGKARALQAPAPNAVRMQCVGAQPIGGAEAAIAPELLKEWRAFTGVIRTTWQVL
jgi:hypothetical protein